MATLHEATLESPAGTPSDGIASPTALAAALQRAGVADRPRIRPGLLSRAPSDVDSTTRRRSIGTASPSIPSASEEDESGRASDHSAGGYYGRTHAQHQHQQQQQQGSDADSDYPQRFAQGMSASAAGAMRSSLSGPPTPLATYANSPLPSGMGSLGPTSQPLSASSTGGGGSESPYSPRSAGLSSASSSQSALHSASGSLYGGAGVGPRSASSSISGGHRNEPRSGVAAQAPFWRRQATGSTGASSSRGANGRGGDVRGGEHRSGGEASEDGGASLGRAKSVSSVSSVTSSSSMEAVPFRAAPLGNTRVGFAGYRGMTPAQARAVPQPSRAGGGLLGTSWPGRREEGSEEMDVEAAQSSAISGTGNFTTPRSGAIAALDPASAPLSPNTRAKVTPKGPSDSWLYRNAPGMGGGRGGRAIPGAPASFSPPSATEQLRMLGVTDADAYAAAGAGNASTSPTRTRASNAIRSKLARSAGKLGLRPLTTMPPGGIAAPPTKEAERMYAQHLALVAATVGGSNALGNAAATAADDAASSSSLEVPGVASSASSLQQQHTGEAMMRTSSVTNAPLVVPKHPPGPPGTGPPPSPGLVGSPTGHSTFVFRGTSPRLSPRALEETSSNAFATSPSIAEEAVQHSGSAVASVLVTAPASPPARGSSPIAMTRNSAPVHGLLAAMGSNAGSYSTSSRSSVSSTASQGLTPAQQVQQDAEAGIARAPAEPSGDTPGPSPFAPSASSPVHEHRLSSTAASMLSPSRARLAAANAAAAASAGSASASQSGSGNSGETSLKSTLFGGGSTLLGGSAGGSTAGSAGARRPKLLRALTSEGALSRTSKASSDSSEVGVSPIESSSPVSPGGSNRSRPRSTRRNVKSEDATPASSRWYSSLSSSATRTPSPRSPIASVYPVAAAPQIPPLPPTNPFAAASVVPARDDGPLGEVFPPRSTDCAAVPAAAPPPPRSSKGSAYLAAFEEAQQRNGSKPFPLRPHMPSAQPSMAPSQAVTLASDSEAAISIKKPPRVVADRAEAPAFKLETEATAAARAPAMMTAAPVETAAVSRPNNALLSSGATTPAAGSGAATPAAAAASTTLAPATATAGASSAAATAPPVTARSARGRDDFEFGEILGEGSYSTVIEAFDLLSVPASANGARTAGAPISANSAIAGAGTAARTAATRKQGLKAYAVKVLDKVHILKEKKQKYVSVEKEALSLLLRHPGVVTLFWTFQDRDSLYFVLELAPNGELLSFIKKLGSFSTQCAQFYAAQLADTIAGMHKVGVIHRDIKPENVLMDANMRIKVTDFGSAKIARKSSGAATPAAATAAGEETRARASSFVGTAEYVSPELLTEKAATESSDWWAFGCVVYQMLAGRPPFKGPNEYQTFQRIIKREFDYPDGFPAEARDLIDRLLVLDPAQRLGSAPLGFTAIREHAFFKGVEWENLWKTDVPELQAGLFKRKAPSRTPSEMAVDFGDGTWVNDELLSSGSDVSVDQEAAASGDDEDRQDRESQLSVETRDSAEASPAANAAGAEADDDDSSGSDAPHQPRRRGASHGAERQPTPRRGSAMFRVAAGISNLASGSSTVGRPPAQRASVGGLRNLSNRFSVVSINTSSSSLAAPGAADDSLAPHASLHPPPVSAAAQATSWAALLLPHEALLYACPITQRKTGAFRSTSKKRQLLLTDFPRLLCVKETQDQLLVKSEVILAARARTAASLAVEQEQDASSSLHVKAESAEMRRLASAGASVGSSEVTPRAKAVRRDSLPAPLMTTQSLDAAPNFMTGLEARGTRGFVVHTPARSYIYEDPGGDSSYWLRSIKAAANGR